MDESDVLVFTFGAIAGFVLNFLFLWMITNAAGRYRPTNYENKRPRTVIPPAPPRRRRKVDR